MCWVTRTLGDICDEVDGLIRTGPFGSQLHESDYCDEGVPVIMPKDIVDGRVATESIARIGEEDVQRLAQHKVRRGDIIYGRRGDIGRRALVTDREEGWLCGTGCLRVSLGDSIIDPYFLYYYLGERKVTTWIYNQAVGATLPNLNTSIIRNIAVSYPPLPTQRKIAAILSAYDDLVENNSRRIRILEDMAQALYREWFVHFRFPGHEDVPMVETELGLVPEGWEVRKLAELVEINATSIKRGNEPDTVNYVDIASVSTGQIDKVEPMAFAEAPGRARRIVMHGDIIWSTVRPNRKSYSLILNPLPNMVVSTGFAVVSAKRVPYTYLYHALTTDGFVAYLTNRAKGAAYPAVSTGDFEDAAVLLPPQDLLHKFAAVTSDMLDLKHNLLAKNATLRRTRDLLLPRLVSGEVEVGELDVAGISE